MTLQNRRKFIKDVGQGMLFAGLGSSLASDLGFSTAFAEDGETSISLGGYTQLVELMRNTPPEKLQPLLAKKYLSGKADLKQITAAGALANAISFGGRDYVGFHTAMAMNPALGMSDKLSKGRKALPILKVIYRNSQQIQKIGGSNKDALRALDQKEFEKELSNQELGIKIRNACRNVNAELGEQLLATVGNSPLQAFNALQPAMQDDINVHRFVFAHRTYGLIDLVGKDHAYTLLRQCVQFCTNHEQNRVRRKFKEPEIRKLMPKLVDQYKLDGKKFGKKDPGDAYVDKLSVDIYNGPNDKAAELVAAALSEGIDPEVVGEAISLASNLLVLRQGANIKRTHGDSVGVHSSDATNAWRNMARYANTYNAMTGLIVAAYHACRNRRGRNRAFTSEAYPWKNHLASVTVKDQKGLLREAEAAIRSNDQGKATAVAQIYGEQNYAVGPFLDLMLSYAISEDGRLHGEKYFHTVCEEFKTIRPAFRWRQIVGLARVTASAYGYNREDKHGFRAAGYEEACKLLGVEA